MRLVISITKCAWPGYYDKFILCFHPVLNSQHYPIKTFIRSLIPRTPTTLNLSSILVGDSYLRRQKDFYYTYAYHPSRDVYYSHATLEYRNRQDIIMESDLIATAVLFSALIVPIAHNHRSRTSAMSWTWGRCAIRSCRTSRCCWTRTAVHCFWCRAGLPSELRLVVAKGPRGESSNPY